MIENKKENSQHQSLHGRPRCRVVFLIRRDAIAEDLVVADGVLESLAGFVTVALDGVNDAVFDADDDPCMVGFAVLRAGVAQVVPVEEDDHAGGRLDRVVGPLAACPEPVHTVLAAGVFRDDAVVYVTALVCAPGHKAGAPFHAGAEAVPGPECLSTGAADLRQGDLDDHII